MGYFLGIVQASSLSTFMITFYALQAFSVCLNMLISSSKLFLKLKPFLFRFFLDSSITSSGVCNL